MFCWRNLFRAQAAVFLIIGLILCLVSKGFVANRGNAESATNIILISVDTLRADHLGCYEYHRQTSPNIDKFAKRGVVFRNTISQSTATLPSHSSIFTSRYPSQHKAVKIGERFRSLEESEVTLAEILKRHGYLTAAFTGGGEMAKVFNINQGFDIYNDKGGGIKNINQRVFKWLEENRDNKFFLFVHCYNPHQPYYPPSPFDLYLSDFDKKIYKKMNRGAVKDEKIERKTLWERMMSLYEKDIAYADKHIGELLPRLDGSDLTGKTLLERIIALYYGEDAYKDKHIGELLHKLDRLDLTGKTLLEKIIALYDGEIAYTDKHIEELLRKLDELELTGKTLIIFTSDHGEEFMEHLGLAHGKTVYGETIEVPLIFKNESLFQPKEINSQVRSIDIAPTILEILNIPIPDSMMGRGLLGLICDKNETERIAFSENEVRSLLGCRSLKNKLILHDGESKQEFYDLENDPGEANILSVDNKHTVYSEFLKKAARWRATIESSAQPDRPMGKLKVLKDEELKEQLRSLGYL